MVLYFRYTALHVMAREDLAVTSPPVVEVRVKRWQLQRVQCCVSSSLLSENATRLPHALSNF
jgi:hypothetical protein